MYRMLTIFMFCLAATWSVSAQTAPVPDKYEIETAADCARYNDDVLRCNGTDVRIGERHSHTSGISIT